MTKKGIVRLGKLLVFIVTIVAMWRWGIRHYVNLEQFQLYSHHFKNLVESHYILAVVGYIVFFTTLIATSLPVVPLLTVIGGYLFGTILGAIYATIGATIGGTLSLVIFKLFFVSLKNRLNSDFLNIAPRIGRY